MEFRRVLFRSDALAADIPAADSPRPVHPEVKPVIGFDRNREFDDRGIAIDRCEGFGIGLPREKGGPADLRQVGVGASLLHLSQQEAVARIIVAELAVRRTPLVHLVEDALAARLVLFARRPAGAPYLVR